MKLIPALIASVHVAQAVNVTQQGRPTELNYADNPEYFAYDNHVLPDY